MNHSASCLVSVVTPCRNAEAFIAAAIDSVRAQTLTDWEMIVVDDASTDASAAIVADYAARDHRIGLVSLPRPGGAAGARNTAIRRARGRYIAFLDSDDLWFPDKLARQIAFMTAHNQAFSYASYSLIDTEDRGLGVFMVAPSITRADLLKKNSVSCLTAIYDTRALGKMYMPDIATGHDYALWLEILKRVETARGLPEPLAAYRIKKTSLSSNKLRAARRRWWIYRRHERLGRASSAYYFCHYAYHGLVKYLWTARIRRWLAIGEIGGGGGRKPPHSNALNKAGKKILVLTSRWPYPVVGGDRLRIYAICRELSEHHTLTLLSLCESRAEMEMALPDDGVFSAAQRVFLPRWRSWLNCLAALPGTRPLQVAYYQSAAFRAKLAALLPGHDLAFAHLIRTAEYLRGRSDCKAPKVLDMTDAISLTYARVSEIGGVGIRNLVYRLERRRLPNYERRAAGWFDLTLLCSPVDRDFLFPPPAPANILVCANGVDYERIPFSYRPPEPPAGTIVFIGNMTTLQNLDAARWFCRRVMPLVRQTNRRWRFKIIGRMAPRERAKFNRLPGVAATGYVADVVAEARGATVGVCPVRIGAGIQNKMLDYLAMGLPCITSRVGTEGLRARPGEDILVADTPGEYAAAIARIDGNRAEARRLSANGRRYVEAHHSWRVNLAPLLEALQALPIKPHADAAHAPAAGPP